VVEKLTLNYLSRALVNIPAVSMQLPQLETSVVLCCVTKHAQNERNKLFFVCMENRPTLYMLHLYLHLHLGHLADALIQSDLQIGAFTL
jgi:hypothetical protein